MHPPISILFFFSSFLKRKNFIIIIIIIIIISPFSFYSIVSLLLLRTPYEATHVQTYTCMRACVRINAYIHIHISYKIEKHVKSMAILKKNIEKKKDPNRVPFFSYKYKKYKNIICMCVCAHWCVSMCTCILYTLTMSISLFLSML
ncbi:hypothetical protein J3Q64DRAFT_1288419 [Phycomyces blakesleeanus]|uniref:Uncharacterized protein n=1 Tax=Phycomyces blakesleeanus TaxID=4837 RepID=A0ABR3AQZ4_PHYBL